MKRDILPIGITQKSSSSVDELLRLSKNYAANEK